MKTPLYISTQIKDQTQSLIIYQNGNRLEVTPPIQPYAYNVRKVGINDTELELVEKLPISTLTPTKMFKYSFRDSSQISWINRQKDERLKSFCENHVLFTHRCVIDEPEWFRQYDNTQPLKVLTFDIETLSEKGVYKDNVLCIGYAVDDEPEQIIISDDEREMLDQFRKLLQQVDPDIIIGYNHRKFDIPKIEKRCKFYDMLMYFGRNKTKDEGRVFYDVWSDVSQDQMLFKLRNRKLKTVARHFGIEMIQEDTRDTGSIPLDQLAEYCKSDVHGTRELFKIYFPKTLALCERFRVPLNIAVDNRRAFMAKIWSFRILNQLGIVNDGTNHERHKDIYDRLKDERYQGAIVSISKPGSYHKRVWKIDFSGMYPAIAMSLNLGVDTCSIIGDEPLGPYRVEQFNGHKIHSIPDENLYSNFLIRILDTPSEFTTQLIEMKKVRTSVKKQQNQSPKDSDEWVQFDSEQNAYKILANSWIGINGEKSSRSGDLSVVVPVAGAGRWCINKVRDFIKDKYGDIEIATHTDGIYLTQDVNIDAINEFIRTKFQDFFLVKNNQMSLEKDEYREAYFHRAPVYILRDMDGTVILKGVTFLSSKHSVMIMDFIDRASVIKLDDTDPVPLIREFQNMAQFPTERFIMRVSINKDQYDKGSLYQKIMDQAKLVGLPVEVGSTFEYVETKVGHQILPLVTSRSEINEKYYMERLEKICESFGWVNQFNQAKAGSTLDQFCEK